MKYFKIYGQQRTGTNYFSTLMNTNFKDVDIFMNVGGWKHGLLIEYPNQTELINRVDKDTATSININNTIKLFNEHKVFFMILVKNPYLWIYSLSNFENKELTIEYVSKNINIWNQKYLNYKNHIVNNQAYLIKYESLIKYPDKTLNKIKDYFKLTTKYNKYYLQNNILGANSDYTIGKTTNKLFKNKYLYIDDNRYISTILKPCIIKTINKHINRSLMRYYKYDIHEI
jgi:hypothetical protein